MNTENLNQLLLEALETEIGGVQVYKTALKCAINGDLKKEWHEYLEQTEHHVEVVRNVCEKFGIDTNSEIPGRKVVRHIGESLVQAMEMALTAGKPEAAQIVAAECVVEAETKDHLNWQLISEVVPKLTGEERKALKEAHEEVEEEEDEHLYHTKGWCRELWLESLGLPAVLPPPEEEKQVKTAIGAERAKQSRKEMLYSCSDYQKDLLGGSMNTISQEVPVRLSQTDSRLLLVAPLPGIKPSNILVTIDGRTVKISGHQTGPGQEEKDLLMEEWTMGPYYREVELPQTVDGKLTNATFGNGVLILAMPKAAEEVYQPITFKLDSIDAARGERIGHQGTDISPA